MSDAMGPGGNRVLYRVSHLGGLPFCLVIMVFASFAMSVFCCILLEKLENHLLQNKVTPDSVFGDHGLQVRTALPYTPAAPHLEVVERTPHNGAGDRPNSSLDASSELTQRVHWLRKYSFLQMAPQEKVQRTEVR